MDKINKKHLEVLSDLSQSYLETNTIETTEGQKTAMYYDCIPEVLFEYDCTIKHLGYLITPKDTVYGDGDGSFQQVILSVTEEGSQETVLYAYEGQRSSWSEDWWEKEPYPVKEEKKTITVYTKVQGE